MISSAALVRHADHTARWSAVVLGFSIPISVAVDNVLLVLVLTGWLAGGAYRAKILTARRHPVALAALALFVLLLIGTLYGDTRAGVAWAAVGKYVDLMFIPIFLFLFRDPATRRYALYALSAALALVLILSCLIKSGVVPANPLTIGDAASPYVFKKRLTHNILMAFAVFLFAWLALQSSGPRARLGWAALAALAIINVTLMVQGATGYLVLCGLAMQFGYHRRGWRGCGMAVLASGLVAAALMMMPSLFQQRINAITSEINEWHSDQPTQTSSGLRLEFYRKSLEIVREHPLFGTGTGSFTQVYANHVATSTMAVTTNPHNEYLNIAVQLGFVGLAALLYLFYCEWRHTARLATTHERELARGLVITFVIGCLFNSMLMDHVEGLLFAWASGLFFAGSSAPTKSEGPAR
jgi:O-antigen ligase